MSDGLDPAIEALSAGTPPSLGRYRYDGSVWTWTDEMFAIHGFAPGEVVPSGDLMLAHVDPDEVPGARVSFKQALLSGLPYASYHHLLDAAGRRRTVLVTGWGRLDDRGEVAELVGTMADLTDVVHSDLQVEVGAAVAGVTEHRAAIEQAKGMLMLAFGLSSDDAFNLLRTHSQHGNVKVQYLAARLTATALEEPGDAESVREWVLRVLADVSGACQPPTGGGREP